MTASQPHPKKELRRQVLARLKSMTSGQQMEASGQACALLRKQALWQQAQSVLFFASLPGELDLWPLLVEALDGGKAVALPRFDAEAGCYRACRIRDLAQDVRSGHLGIREPVERCGKDVVNRLDLILVPGIAFDLHGRRLGRGKGHYDRLLTAVHGRTCGAGFDEQLVPRVPVEPHDIHLNCILTPTRWIELQAGARF